ncbi:MAG: hypothetical protein UR33_C0006G0047 [Candidatus Woesebacteria bacterium GW2011_GWA2_33_20]|uniref:Uncharacterized protein n=1 Tax=Candidatus Woesebacteria bacterium GW2011_GWB1_33_22 TaxID=1618566 RepID=A0A0G0CMZ1_9BACT|nr:MAG: hypothetical protein UR33_C0006G0047 [Candidatus Woesebacteria bacterium GW2011_GWA2_33_20]KKP44787.1 MAG: hypothetical protein UR35_C0006G0022 [Candidatus Woesebacteria bacterium GW2011_GWB1_33_22]KKP46606.1 MAG: hypothetical protein UR37_C0006G0056 [Microgenomates group bacterium GW2011_GWC1_33_28]KKP50519.1 MAG: hypothetical protein UR41_C0006G0022 [Candidatus Woesebacteria bacterium GW2011_GWA1_33_33]OGM87503.1 MAG: hypothetical protein A2616_03260 [Candidatus Woesebacteria bacteriu
MRIKSTKKEFIEEIFDSISNIEFFLKDIIENNAVARIKPLSVEIRKLLNPNSNGDSGLKRVEHVIKRTFIFPDRSKILPPTRIDVGLDEYINRMIFSIGGRPVTRIEVVKLVADQKGAHIDDGIDPLHRQSQGTILPLGNPARDKLFFEQNHLYIIEIAKTIVQVVTRQLSRG